MRPRAEPPLSSKFNAFLVLGVLWASAWLTSLADVEQAVVVSHSGIVPKIQPLQPPHYCLGKAAFRDKSGNSKISGWKPTESDYKVYGLFPQGPVSPEKIESLRRVLSNSRSVALYGHLSALSIPQNPGHPKRLHDRMSYLKPISERCCPGGI